jgi:uncharacterized protein (DUF433 family)
MMQCPWPLAEPYIYVHITKIPGVLGGEPTIDGRRVRVADIVSLHRDGYSPERIQEVYDFLSLGQIHAALAYYYDGHQQEIDASLELDRRWGELVLQEWNEHRNRRRTGQIPGESGALVEVVSVARDRE